MAKTQEVTDATFEQQVLNAKGVVLVDFYTDWCPPCRVLAPILDTIAQEQEGKLTVLKLNAEENERTQLRFGVMGFPTMILFKDGEPVKQLIGARPKPVLLRELAPYLG